MYYADELSIALLIVALVCTVLLIFIIISKNKKASEKKPEKVPPVKARPLATADTRAATASIPRVYEDPTRDIDTIYRYTRRRDFWVCPACEAENPLSSVCCCLCHQKR